MSSMLDGDEPRGTGKRFRPAVRRAGSGSAAASRLRLDELADALRIGSAQSGVVYLVGAGPGDPGLLGVRAARLIATADVILHDLLVAREVVDLAAPDAELYDVGKVGAGRHVAQSETNALMVRLAREGRSVVRLKGGDPFVFGRGGEELGELIRAGVRAEVVPGVASGTGALAAAGIPLTQRGVAAGAAFVTGHSSSGEPGAGHDWAALAAFPGTLVFYMGVKALPQITAELIAHGRRADQPAAVVERGTTDAQRVTRSTLGRLAADAKAAEVAAPALIVVGDVAALAGELDWRSRRPLAGRRVVVTRSGSHAGRLAGMLRAEGAAVVELPAIRPVPTGVPLPDFAGVDLVCVTSPGAADALTGALAEAGRDARVLAGARVAAIGPGTAAALRANGVVPDLTPSRAVSEGLVELIRAQAQSPRNVLVIQARGGRSVLADELRADGSEVVVAHLHESEPITLTPSQLGELQAADAVLFASGSAVRAVAAALGGGEHAQSDGCALDGTASNEALVAVRSVAIGPVTAAALRELGAEPAAIADPHTLDGLVQATRELLG